MRLHRDYPSTPPHTSCHSTIVLVIPEKTEMKMLAKNLRYFHATSFATFLACAIVIIQIPNNYQTFFHVVSIKLEKTKGEGR